MRILYFALFGILIALSSSSCKTDGCMDEGALNFDSKADNPATCNYTNFVFYAATDMIGGFGVKVERIEIFRSVVGTETKIGEITIMNQGQPESCDMLTNGAFVVTPEGSGTFQFTTQYHFVNGTTDRGDSFDFSTSPTQQCILQNLTL